MRCLRCPALPRSPDFSFPCLSGPLFHHPTLVFPTSPLHYLFVLLPSESHFLTKLHRLKMLSITPSQLENGKKITTYDYRYAGPGPPWGSGWTVSHPISQGERKTNAMSESRDWHAGEEMAEGWLFPSTRLLSSLELWSCTSSSFPAYFLRGL